MADIDIDSFGEYESRPEEPMDERILLDPVTPEEEAEEPVIFSELTSCDSTHENDKQP